MIAFFLILTDDSKRAWIRADEVGTFYETNVYPKPGPGRPPADGPKAVPVIMLTLRNGNKVAARNESIETIRNKLKQALGQQIHMVERCAWEPGEEPAVVTEAA